MKKLTTPSGVFGPYKNVDVLDDRYRADGADLPFTVVGSGGVVSQWTDPIPADPPPPPPTAAEKKQDRKTRRIIDMADGRKFDVPDSEALRLLVLVKTTVAFPVQWPKANGNLVNLSKADVDEILLKVVATYFEDNAP